jgi:hypothetical protein
MMKYIEIIKPQSSQSFKNQGRKGFHIFLCVLCG